MPPASVDEEVLPHKPKLDASDEPKLEASGDDATQADAEPASVTAQDDDGAEYW